jgi:hypothetical protein
VLAIALDETGHCIGPCLSPLISREDATDSKTSVVTFERCLKLLLTDRMRTTGIRSDVTETEHVRVPATTSHRRQTCHLVSPLIAIDRVEDPQSGEAT